MRQTAMVMIVGCIGAFLLAAGPGVAQEAAGKAAQAAGKGANKPLFVAKMDTQISWNELRDRHGWNGRPTMPMLETRGQATTGGWDEKTGLFMTKGRFALDNLEIEGEIGQGANGVLFKQGTKILSRR